MRPVFGDEIKSAENKETHENDVCARGEEAPLPAFVTAMIYRGLHKQCPSPETRRNARRPGLYGVILAPAVMRAS